MLRVLIAARMAWAAYTARKWAVVADAAIMAALVAAAIYLVAA